MCDVTAALAVVSLGFTVLGTLNQARGAAQTAAAGQQQAAAQTQVAQQQYQYQAAVERNNAQAAQSLAQDELAQGVVEERQYRQQAGSLRARQVAVLAASGVALDDDSSALDVLADTDTLAAYDVGVIRRNAERRAYEQRLRAMNFDSQAALDDYGAASAPVTYAYTGPSPSQASSSALLSGAGSVAERWYGLSKAGVF
ncbi:hypothetical protein SAMN06265365_12327 [Tistlia consotensis]|uniref:Uncharacterized protein n=1 Tax=Tistlia consotensis USBA 355 TaxID=560819 RepID=A0A1Y6CPY3_9PROT|nr:hypothetical protein [Tistlia consotensis]SMF64700.1 hypothetical protein SAMN05428998_12582 [Tistlia consotensis USBA 355]SNR96927.1 hypothetical protein SAMN06265365_12327 [Tistlia consotensis]